MRAISNLLGALTYLPCANYENIKGTHRRNYRTIADRISYSSAQNVGS
jgi:hypothetical protein